MHCYTLIFAFATIIRVTEKNTDKVYAYVQTLAVTVIYQAVPVVVKCRIMLLLNR